MAFRSAPGAVVAGSTTAGADGDVPDVVVRPIVAGIRAGRDEVLEAGIRQILGTKVSDSEIRSLIKP